MSQELIELRNAAQTLLNADGPHPKYVADIAYRKEAHPAAVISLLDQIQTLQAENERLNDDVAMHMRVAVKAIDEVVELKAERDALAAKLVPLEADAERYRWLRKALSDRSSKGKSHHFCSIHEGHPEELDAAIDASKGGQQ